MKLKQKIKIWFLLLVFCAYSFFPFGNQISDSASAATISGYASEGIAFYINAETAAGLAPIYRLYKSATTDRIYTASADEKTSALGNEYALESLAGKTDGVAFYTYPDDAATTPEIIAAEGLVKIYRLYNESSDSRVYVIESEKDAFLKNSFALEPADTTGIAFYAYPSTVAAEIITAKKLIPVYKLHNETAGDYLYTASETEKTALLTETAAPATNLGPEISVGLWNTSKNSLKETPFKIKANKDYNIKDKDGNILATVAGATATRVATHTVTTITYQNDDNDKKSSSSSSKKKKKKKKKSTKKKATKKKSSKKKSTKKKKKKSGWLQEMFVPTAYADQKQIITNTEYLKIYNSVPEKLLTLQELYFDAKDGNNTDMIFDVSRPGSDYDQYRGKMKIKYTDNDNIWMINILPMEQYVWGMGETTGTGPKEHTKLMTAIFRTYGYWYAEYATKYILYGFRIRSDSGSQIYRGYDWETKYANIKPAAEETKGTIAMYKKEIALTPYSSWTDGKTRSFEERWGSKDYPWCQSVKDPYGKHPTSNTEALVAAGNHMVGLSANGSLKLAGSDYKWDYKKILKYYYTGIDLTSKY